MTQASDDPAPAADTRPGHTDIKTGGWVASLPPGWRPYILLARLDRPVGAWLLFLPGLWTILASAPSAAEAVWLTALFFAGSFLMRAAGCVVNDMWDRDLDRQVTRTIGRPLASGALRMRHAAGFLLALLLASLGILLCLTPLAQLLGVASLALVTLYPLAKRVTWWPQLMLGLTFGWGAPMGYAAAAGHIDAATAAFYLAAILWILGYDTIYAHQDREDDALVGMGSTARLFGRNTGPFLCVCYAGVVLALAAGSLLMGLSRWGVVALVLPALLLARQIVRLDIDNAPLCLALFKSNREVGLLVALALLIGRL